MARDGNEIRAKNEHTKVEHTRKTNKKNNIQDIGMYQKFGVTMVTTGSQTLLKITGKGDRKNKIQDILDCARNLGLPW